MKLTESFEKESWKKGNRHVHRTWGSGKTFFVKQCKLLLDACNSQSNMSADERDSICKAMEKKNSLNSLKNLLMAADFFREELGRT